MFILNICRAENKHKNYNIDDTSTAAKHNCYQVRTMKIILFSLFSEQFILDQSSLCKEGTILRAKNKHYTLVNKVTCRIQLEKEIPKYVSRCTDRRDRLRNNVNPNLLLKKRLNTLKITQNVLKAQCS